MSRFGRALRAGDRFRIREGDGTVYRIRRVTPCAAYYEVRTPRQIVNAETGEVTAEFESVRTVPISIHAQVEIVNGL